MIQKAAARYLEYMVHGFYDGLLTLIYELNEGNKGVISPDELETLYALGYNHFQTGNYEEAKKIFGGLTKLSSDQGYYWRALGAVNQQMGNYSEAIKGYDRAIAEDPNDEVSHVYRCESYALLGDTKKAVEELRKILKIFSNRLAFSPWIKRADLLLRLNEKSSLEAR